MTALTIASMASILAPKSSVTSPSNPPKTPKEQKLTTESMPTTPTKLILKPSSIDEFVDWCKDKRGEDWSECVEGMRKEEIFS